MAYKEDDAPGVYVDADEIDRGWQQPGGVAAARIADLERCFPSVHQEAFQLRKHIEKVLSDC